MRHLNQYQFGDSPKNLCVCKVTKPAFGHLRDDHLVGTSGSSWMYTKPGSGSGVRCWPFPRTLFLIFKLREACTLGSGFCFEWNCAFEITLYV